MPSSQAEHVGRVGVQGSPHITSVGHVARRDASFKRQPVSRPPRTRPAWDHANRVMLSCAGSPRSRQTVVTVGVRGERRGRLWGGWRGRATLPDQGCARRGPYRPTHHCTRTAERAAAVQKAGRASESGHGKYVENSRSVPIASDARTRRECRRSWLSGIAGED